MKFANVKRLAKIKINLMNDKANYAPPNKIQINENCKYICVKEWRAAALSKQIRMCDRVKFDDGPIGL